MTVPAWVVDFPSFRRWNDSEECPERYRVSWFDGELVVDMTGHEIDSHGRVKLEIQAALQRFVRERDLGEVHGDPTSFVHDETRMSHEPDAMVVLWESLDAGRVVYREIVEGSGRLMEVTGEVDLAVEVVSRSSVTKDVHLLPVRYFEAGVREYWIVDARSTGIELNVRTRGTDGFESIAADEEGFVASPLLGASFRLVRTQTPRGVNVYVLEHRS